MSEDFQAGGGGVLLSLRTTASCSGQEAALTVGGIGEAGTDVVLSEFRVVGDNGLMGHASGEPAQNVGHRDAHAADAGATAALARFDGDDGLIVHVLLLL